MHFFPCARYVATIRKPEKLIIRDIIGENYNLRARTAQIHGIERNLYDPSSQFD